MIFQELQNYTVNLTNPTGIREISVKTITVKVSVDAIATTEVDNVKINITNLAKGYTAQAANSESSAITVIVQGSKTVIDKLDKSTINATVDLQGLGVGEHEVEVTVNGADSKLSYTPRVKKVKVIISKK